MSWSQLFKIGGFTWLFVGQLISALGDWTSVIIIPMMLYKLTSDPVSIGILMICRFLPSVLFSPFIGKIVNKFSSLKIMILADFLRGGMFLLFLYVESPLLIYIFTFFIYLGTAFFNPGKFHFITKLIPIDLLARANSCIAGINQLMILIGPAIGGIVFGIFGLSVGIIFNSLTFFFSMFALIKIKISKIEEENYVKEENYLKSKNVKKRHFLKGFFNTYTSLKIKKMLFYIVVGDAIASMGFGSLNVLFPIFAKDVFYSNQAAYGYLMSFLGGGLLLGTMLGPNLQRGIRSDLLYSISTAVAALFAFLFGGSGWLLLSIVLIFFVGMGNGVQENAAITFIQKETTVLGNTADVFSVYQALTSVSIVIAMTGSTILVKIVGIHLATMYISLIPLLIGILMFFASFLNKQKDLNLDSEY